MVVEFNKQPLVATAQLYADVDGEKKLLVEFPISRYNPELNVGFIPYAPVTASFNATTAKNFELVVKSDRNYSLSRLHSRDPRREPGLQQDSRQDARDPAPDVDGISVETGIGARA